MEIKRQTVKKRRKMDLHFLSKQSDNIKINAKSDRVELLKSKLSRFGSEWVSQTLEFETEITEIERQEPYTTRMPRVEHELP